MAEGVVRHGYPAAGLGRHLFPRTACTALRTCVVNASLGSWRSQEVCVLAASRQSPGRSSL